MNPATDPPTLAEFFAAWDLFRDPVLAAMIAGATLGYLGVYRRLVLPNSGSMLASLGALMFIESWNAFLWPLVIGQDPSSWTAQIALSTFLNAQQINLPALFAGALVIIAPLVAMFLVAQRYIVSGIAASGLKE